MTLPTDLRGSRVMWRSAEWLIAETHPEHGEVSLRCVYHTNHIVLGVPAEFVSLGSFDDHPHWKSERTRT